MAPRCLSRSRAALVRWPRGDSPTPDSCVEAWTLVLVSSLSEAVSSQTPRTPALSLPYPPLHPPSELWCLMQASHQ